MRWPGCTQNVQVSGQSQVWKYGMLLATGADTEAGSEVCGQVSLGGIGSAVGTWYANVTEGVALMISSFGSSLVVRLLGALGSDVSSSTWQSVKQLG